VVVVGALTTHGQVIVTPFALFLHVELEERFQSSFVPRCASVRLMIDEFEVSQASETRRRESSEDLCMQGGREVNGYLYDMTTLLLFNSAKFDGLQGKTL